MCNCSCCCGTEKYDAAEAQQFHALMLAEEGSVDSRDLPNGIKLITYAKGTQRPELVSHFG